MHTDKVIERLKYYKITFNDKSIGFMIGLLIFLVSRGFLVRNWGLLCGFWLTTYLVKIEYMDNSILTSLHV
jgi:hypothetical protein